MTNQLFTKYKYFFVTLVSLIAWATLSWQHFHGGVLSHHLLHRADLPAISNWWGAIVVPLLSWGLLSVVQKRLPDKNETESTKEFKQAVIGFVLAFAYGTLLSQLFVHGYSQISSVLFPGILAFALFFKVYKAEFLLGFVLSMSVVFGAVLPTLFGAIIGFAAFIVHAVVQFFWPKLSLKSSTA